MNVLLGNHELTFPSSDLGELRDCNDLLGDFQTLHTRMEEDGYLLIRGFFDRTQILTARRAILKFGRDSGNQIFKSGTDLMDAVVNPDGRMVRTNGNREVTHRPDVLVILEGDILFDFFQHYFDTPVRTLSPLRKAILWKILTFSSL